VKETIAYIVSELRPIYSEEEARELAYWVVEYSTGMTRTEILFCNQEQEIPNLKTILDQLRKHTPIQYIFGHTDWMGLHLKVTPDTLIPRPETSELIEWITATCDTKAALNVLDIGTGSGCIAIALKKRCPAWHIQGIDISAEALGVAHANAELNNVKVDWIQADILSPITETRILTPDIIVSNPPYICHREKIDMDARVLDYEPHIALFVPDDDPLLFYRQIASMKSAKSLYFEINEAYGKEVCDMLKDLGYTDIKLKHDIYGKARMVFGRIEA
jgi:release factor glutamine methyltransferase